MPAPGPLHDDHDDVDSDDDISANSVDGCFLVTPEYNQNLSWKLLLKYQSPDFL